jgi:hypothetical protein
VGSGFDLVWPGGVAAFLVLGLVRLLAGVPSSMAVGLGFVGALVG